VQAREAAEAGRQEAGRHFLRGEAVKTLSIEVSSPVDQRAGGLVLYVGNDWRLIKTSNRKDEGNVMLGRLSAWT
jgi:hypothetical protein